MILNDYLKTLKIFFRRYCQMKLIDKIYQKIFLEEYIKKYFQKIILIHFLFVLYLNLSPIAAFIIAIL